MLSIEVPPALFPELSSQNNGSPVLSFPGRRLKSALQHLSSLRENDHKTLKLGNAPEMVHLASSSYSEAQNQLALP